MQGVLFGLSIRPSTPLHCAAPEGVLPDGPASLHGPQLTGQGLWSPSLAGCCCQAAPYSSALCPTPQTQTLVIAVTCSNCIDPPAAGTLPSALPLWALGPSPSLPGERAEVQCACSPVPCLVSGESHRPGRS